MAPRTPKTEMPAAASGAMREGLSQKIPTHLVPPELIMAAAVSFNFGAVKYEPRNFEKGFPLSSLLNSADRHVRAMMCGEMIDEESGLPHYCMLAASVGMLCHNIMQNVVEFDIPAREGRNGQAATTVASLARYAQVLANPIREGETA